MELRDLWDIVSKGEFGRLIGEIEGQYLDVKGQPYLLDSGMDAKRELAKDVAAFANARGGCIVIGATTKDALLRAGEEIDAVYPIPQSMFDPVQHQKVLSEWLYPLPIELYIALVPFGADLGKGIGVVFVPEQDERRKPFLITRSMGDKKSTEILIGYAERRLDMNEPRTVEELHLALRTGFSLERELMGRIENLEFLIQKHFALALEPVMTAKRDQLIQERVRTLLEADSDRRSDS